MIFTNPRGAPELACDECGCRWFDRLHDCCYECGARVSESARKEYEEALARFAVPTSHLDALDEREVEGSARGVPVNRSGGAGR